MSKNWSPLVSLRVNNLRKFCQLFLFHYTQNVSFSLTQPANQTTTTSTLNQPQPTIGHKLLPSLWTWWPMRMWPAFRDHFANRSIWQLFLMQCRDCLYPINIRICQIYFFNIRFDLVCGSLNRHDSPRMLLCWQRERADGSYGSYRSATTASIYICLARVFAHIASSKGDPNPSVNLSKTISSVQVILAVPHKDIIGVSRSAPPRLIFSVQKT